MRGISWVAEHLLASQEGLRFMKYVSKKVIMMIMIMMIVVVVVVVK